MKKIEKLLVLILIFCTSNFFSFSISKAEKESLIKQIQSEYLKIDNNLKNYETKSITVNLSQESDFFVRGEKIVFYTENGELRKIVNHNNYPHEKRIIEYYIKNKIPYFIRSSRIENDGKASKGRKISDDFNTYGYYITPETAEELLGIQLNGESVETEEEEEGSFDDLLYDILVMYVEIYDLQ